MKSVIKTILFFGAALLVFSACEKDENRVIFEGGTAPVLKATPAGPLVLKKDKEAETAMTLNWSNPDYKFNTGISSQNVLYVVQIDKAGSNFASPQEITINSDLATPLTVKQLNAALLGLNLAHDVAQNIEMRVKSNLQGGAGTLFSNVEKLTITPYLDVKYPVPASLFMIGAATPNGWGEPIPASQQFTKINDYTYELTLNLAASSGYLFRSNNQGWDGKLGFTGDKEANNTMGDNFKPEGADFKSPAEAGKYKITVDFKTGKFSLQKV